MIGYEKKPWQTIILRIQSQSKMRDETEKTIYGSKKANNLSTHGGSEGGVGCSWEEKAKAIGAPSRNWSSPSPNWVVSAGIAWPVQDLIVVTLTLGNVGEVENADPLTENLYLDSDITCDAGAWRDMHNVICTTLQTCNTTATMSSIDPKSDVGYVLLFFERFPLLYKIISAAAYKGPLRHPTHA